MTELNKKLQTLDLSTKQPLFIDGVSRSAFQELQIPILPYCDVKTSYSTANFNSFHIKNYNTNCQLNVFWRIDKTVSVWFYDGRIKNKRNKNREVYKTSKHFNSKILSDLCSQYLADG